MNQSGRACGDLRFQTRRPDEDRLTRLMCAVRLSQDVSKSGDAEGVAVHTISARKRALCTKGASERRPQRIVFDGNSNRSRSLRLLRRALNERFTIVQDSRVGYKRRNILAWWRICNPAPNKTILVGLEMPARRVARAEPTLRTTELQRSATVGSRDNWNLQHFGGR
jgi:hypothetical protein